jgi:hypothetical protein
MRGRPPGRSPARVIVIATYEAIAMSNVTVPSSNDGFPAGLPGDRVTRGTIARWSETTGWVDRDGLPLPDTMLVVGYTTVLRRWQEKKPEYKTEHPLPDPEQLNAAIRSSNGRSDWTASHVSRGSSRTSSTWSTSRRQVPCTRTHTTPSAPCLLSITWRNRSPSCGCCAASMCFQSCISNGAR